MRVSLALLFPGQGTQHPALLPWLDAEAAAVCQPLVAAFGTDWRARLADAEWAQRNVVAQPLLTGIGVAAWCALAPRLPKPAVVAGYSVGELAAFHAAGVIGAADAMAIAHRRAELMDASTAGVATGLMSLANAPSALVAQLCSRHQLAVAIRLAPDHVIVGGSRSALNAAEGEANAAGMKATPLAVATASHTPWMAGAVAPFAELLQTIVFERPHTPLVCDHEAGVLFDRAQLRHALAAQLAETVRWDDCMNAVEERGVRCVLEMGPGSALSRMWNARSSHAAARSIDEFKTLDAITRWVADALA